MQVFDSRIFYIFYIHNYEFFIYFHFCSIFIFLNIWSFWGNQEVRVQVVWEQLVAASWVIIHVDCVGSHPVFFKQRQTFQCVQTLS